MMMLLCLKMVNRIKVTRSSATVRAPSSPAALPRRLHIISSSRQRNGSTVYAAAITTTAPVTKMRQQQQQLMQQQQQQYDDGALPRGGAAAQQRRHYYWVPLAYRGAVVDKEKRRGRQNNAHYTKKKKKKKYYDRGDVARKKQGSGKMTSRQHPPRSSSSSRTRLRGGPRGTVGGGSGSGPAGLHHPGSRRRQQQQQQQQQYPSAAASHAHHHHQHHQQQRGQQQKQYDRRRGHGNEGRWGEDPRRIAVPYSSNQSPLLVGPDQDPQHYHQQNRRARPRSSRGGGGRRRHRPPRSYDHDMQHQDHRHDQRYNDQEENLMQAELRQRLVQLNERLIDLTDQYKEQLQGDSENGDRHRRHRTRANNKKKEESKDPSPGAVIQEALDDLLVVPPTVNQQQQSDDDDDTTKEEDGIANARETNYHIMQKMIEQTEKIFREICRTLQHIVMTTTALHGCQQEQFRQQGIVNSDPDEIQQYDESNSNSLIMRLDQLQQPQRQQPQQQQKIDSRLDEGQHYELVDLAETAVRYLVKIRAARANLVRCAVTDQQQEQQEERIRENESAAAAAAAAEPHQQQDGDDGATITTGLRQWVSQFLGSLAPSSPPSSSAATTATDKKTNEDDDTVRNSTLSTILDQQHVGETDVDDDEGDDPGQPAPTTTRLLMVHEDPEFGMTRQYLAACLDAIALLPGNVHNDAETTEAAAAAAAEETRTGSSPQRDEQHAPGQRMARLLDFVLSNASPLVSPEPASTDEDSFADSIVDWGILKQVVEALSRDGTTTSARLSYEVYSALCPEKHKNALFPVVLQAYVDVLRQQQQRSRGVKTAVTTNDVAEEASPLHTVSHVEDDPTGVVASMKHTFHKEWAVNRPSIRPDRIYQATLVLDAVATSLDLLLRKLLRNVIDENKWQTYRDSSTLLGENVVKHALGVAEYEKFMTNCHQRSEDIEDKAPPAGNIDAFPLYNYLTQIYAYDTRRWDPAADNTAHVSSSRRNIDSAKSILSYMMQTDKGRNIGGGAAYPTVETINVILSGLNKRYRTPQRQDWFANDNDHRAASDDMRFSLGVFSYMMSNIKSDNRSCLPNYGTFRRLFDNIERNKPTNKGEFHEYLLSAMDVVTTFNSYIVMDNQNDFCSFGPSTYLYVLASLLREDRQQNRRPITVSLPAATKERPGTSPTSASFSGLTLSQRALRVIDQLEVQGTPLLLQDDEVLATAMAPAAAAVSRTLYDPALRPERKAYDLALKVCYRELSPRIEIIGQQQSDMTDDQKQKQKIAYAVACEILRRMIARNLFYTEGRLGRDTGSGVIDLERWSRKEKRVNMRSLLRSVIVDTTGGGSSPFIPADGANGKKRHSMDTAYRNLVKDAGL